MNSGNRVAENGRGEIPDWWRRVPAAEKAVLRDLLRSVRGLKGSRSRQVVQAARKWERSIVCFIRFRLMGEGARPGGRVWASPASGRNPRDAVPGRG